MPSETRLDMTSVRRQLIARELQETINYAFIDAELLRRWQLNTGQVMLMNPLSAELAVMRPRLLPGLVAALGRNIARQLERVRLFELGNVFTASDEAGVAPLKPDTLLLPYVAMRSPCSGVNRCVRSISTI